MMWMGLMPPYPLEIIAAEERSAADQLLKNEPEICLAMRYRGPEVGISAILKKFNNFHHMGVNSRSNYSNRDGKNQYSYSTDSSIRVYVKSSCGLK